jgi:endonuclease-3
LFPQAEWVAMSHRLVLHGRYVCKAKKPECGRCVLCEICPSAVVEADTSLAERAERMQSLVRAR